MKHFIRQVTWKFRDCAETYPQLSSEKIYVRSPDDVFRNFKFLFTDQMRERFLVIWLNSANRVSGFEIITEGTLNASLAHPREVFRGAIVATCASIIVAHNHPSGNAEPSAEDVQITKQLTEAGKLVGIPVHDHIIFTDEGYTSLAERGIV
jgi:DNA repair protein RadC